MPLEKGSTTVENFDAVVIGAGQAGPGVAAALAGEGHTVAVIEMAEVGGTCVNHGCKPTKALRASAMVAHSARRAAGYGVHTGEVSVDFPAAIKRVHDMTATNRQNLRDYLTGLERVELIYGQATLVTDPAGDHHRVSVGDRELDTPRVYLNLGARASMPPLPGIETTRAMTETELLALEELPRHLIIVGAGYIGLEFGQMFRRFGSEVSIIAGGGVANREDPDVSQILTDVFTDEGISIRTGRTVRVGPGPDGVQVDLDDGSTVSGSHLLMATGRRSNSDLLGPEHGLATDSRGFFTIDGRFQTSVKGVWALGDVNGHGAFTHTSYQDSQILLEPPRTVDGRITVYAMFTDPPLGRAGMTLQEARESGRRVLTGEVAMSSVSRAILEGETTGVLRILVDADTEEFLGATILGLNADDLVQVISTCIQAGITYPALRDALPIHPTMAEYLPTVLHSLQPLD